MSVKVCHVTSVHPRYDTRIFHKECTSLANVGYDVTLLVADNKAPEIRNGVKIISADFSPQSRWERLRRSASVMFKEAIAQDAEIYHLHDPELLPAAKKLKAHGRKVIFDSHEDVPNQILGKHWIPRHLRKPISVAYTIYANAIMGKLDYLIGATPHLVEKLRQVSLNVEMITNYPILETYTQNEIKLDAKEHCSNVIVFAGSITEQWSHEIILQSIESLDVRYKLAGPSQERYINRLKEYTAWNKVEYMGRIPHEEVPKLFCQSAVGMAVLQYIPNSNGKEGTLSNTKLFEYMLAGLPVICTDFTLWKEIVEKWQCGICVNPTDTSAIAAAICRIIDSPEEAKAMGEAGRRAVKEEFNWATEERKLLALYGELVG